MGENILVIHPDECIDCGVCEPECPAEAIVPDSDDKAAEWAEMNRVFSAQWPNITRKGTPPADAEDWNGKPGKKALLSTEPAELFGLGSICVLRVTIRPKCGMADAWSSFHMRRAMPRYEDWPPS